MFLFQMQYSLARIFLCILYDEALADETPALSTCENEQTKQSAVPGKGYNDGHCRIADCKECIHTAFYVST